MVAGPGPQNQPTRLQFVEPRDPKQCPRQCVKRHARATLQYPGSQGTYGGGMSDAPENSKNSNTVSPGSQVPH